LQAGGFEVVENLSGFDVGERLNRLQFDDDRAAADEIGAVGSAQQMSLVEDGNGMFAGERNVPVGEFDFEGIVIDSFQEAIAQLSMNLHGGADDGVSLGVSLGIGVHCRLGFVLIGGGWSALSDSLAWGEGGNPVRGWGDFWWETRGIASRHPGLLTGRPYGTDACWERGLRRRVKGSGETEGGIGVKEKAGLGSWGRYGDGKIMQRRQPCEY